MIIITNIELLKLLSLQDADKTTKLICDASKNHNFKLP